MIDNKLSEVARVVGEGLARKPKRLPGWLFYDEAGDKLFQSIMRMPEYYLTRCEYEILEAHKEALRELFTGHARSFNLIELGAGDAFKTEVLLSYFSKRASEFIYTPIDVSRSVLETLKARLLKNIPNLAIHPNNNRYDVALQGLENDGLKKVFIFLGANIGNFAPQDAIAFVQRISAVMAEHDQLFVGFDLKKDPRVIQAAYDDANGITRDFNMNLLVRLNRELGADFKTENFRHYACYDPETGQNRSYLVSQIAHDVYIGNTQNTVQFDQWEVIHTEISQKYDEKMIRKLASEAGLHIVDHFRDSKNYFCDVLFKKGNQE